MSRAEMTHEAALEGDGFRFAIRASRFENPGAEDFFDRNWVYGQVEMETSRGGRFSARTDVSFLASELDSFVRELRELDQSLSGTAELHHLEGEFGIVVTLKNGRGTLTAFVRAHVQAVLGCEEVPVNQSYIRGALPAFEALAQAFPVSPSP